MSQRIPLMNNRKVACCEYNKRRQFFIYTTFNVIRFCLMAFLLYWAHHKTIMKHQQYEKFCCSCYYISLNQTHYDDNLDITQPFDLSHCIPSCTTCAYCDEKFNNSAQNAFDYASDNITNESYCPISGYNESKDWIVWPKEWYEDTGCHNDLSLIGFLFVLKSYDAVGTAACVICGCYAALLLLFIILEWTSLKGSAGCFFRMMIIYNLMLSELCLYFLFKAYQYWAKEFNDVGDNNILVTCPFASTNQWIRSWLIVMIIGAMILALMHAIFEIIDCCICCERCNCCQCCEQVVDDVNAHELQRLKRKYSSTTAIDRGCHSSCIKMQFWFGIILLLWLFVLFVVLCIAFVKMYAMNVKVDVYDQFSNGRIIIPATVLAVFGLFDVLFCSVVREIVGKHYHTVKREICSICRKKKQLLDDQRLL
eukprot:93426_1